MRPDQIRQLALEIAGAALDQVVASRYCRWPGLDDPDDITEEDAEAVRAELETIAEHVQRGNFLEADHG
jgi:hypothetical protein